MKQDFFTDHLHVFTYRSRIGMAQDAASMAAAEIVSMLKTQPVVNIVFAAAPSQSEFLDALVGYAEIDWSRVNAFHMDEYIGLPPHSPQSFGNYLKQRIFSKVPFRGVHYMVDEPMLPGQVCDRYARLLTQFPPDMVLMGIGENGHIAFNDPPVADFNDPFPVKVVDLDSICRQQQVNDGCFSDLSAVPRQAITLTIPTLLKAKKIFCIVPGKTKAQAVFNTLNRPVMEDYPSTILRTHKSAKLFLDDQSSVLLEFAG